MQTFDYEKLDLDGDRRWRYEHDGHIDVLPVGFFDAAHHLLQTGDELLVVGMPGDGRPVATACRFVVTRFPNSVHMEPVLSPRLARPRQSS